MGYEGGDKPIRMKHESPWMMLRVMLKRRCQRQFPMQKVHADQTGGVMKGANQRMAQTNDSS